MEKQFNTADFYEKCGCMSASQRAVRRDSVNTDCADSLTMQMTERLLTGFESIIADKPAKQKNYRPPKRHKRERQRKIIIFKVYHGNY